MTQYLSRHLQDDMKKNAERNRARTWKGEPAGPRNFVKQGIYTGEEMRFHWRKTIWDDVPSLMAGERIYKSA